MKKTLKIVTGSLLALVVVALGAAALLEPAQRAPWEGKVAGTEEQVRRGAYLVNHVAACMRCHAEPDRTRFGGPPLPGKEGAGWCFDDDVCFSNISSHPEHGLGRWTDGEVMRAFREGVSRNGEALWTEMPYEDYRVMSDEDAQAVVAYLRTLPPQAQKTRWDIPEPFNQFLKLAPEPLSGPVAGPRPGDSVARGRYLVTLGMCDRCHTPMLPESHTDHRHHPVPGRELSGGVEMNEAPVRSANLTPHPTGLGGMSREGFIALFKAQAGTHQASAEVAMEDNSPMPWWAYSGMTEEDLGAIYDYLRTLPAVDNKVERSVVQPPASARDTP